MQAPPAPTSGVPATHPVLAALRDEPSSDIVRPDDAEAIPAWMAWIGVAAVIKITSGLVAFGLAAMGWLPRLETVGGSPWIYFSQVVVYAGVGIGLVMGSRRDRRAALVGMFFVLIATSFSAHVVERLASQVPGVAGRGLGLIGALQIDAFMPLFLWLFVRRFPRVDLFDRHPSVVDICVRASAVSGIGLFTVNLLLALDRGQTFDRLRVLAARDPHYYYWIPTFALTLFALVFMAVRVRRADPDEQQRARLFLTGFIVGLTPLLVTVLAGTVLPAFGGWVMGHLGSVYGPEYALLLTIPVTAAYSVLVHRALDVRLVIRRAIQYLFATWTVRILTIAPIAAFAVYAFIHRRASVADVVSSTTGTVYLGGVALGLLALARRESWLSAIERRFFREQYDAHVVLSRLIERSRWARTVGEWFDQAASAIDRALHVERVSLLVRNDHLSQYATLNGASPPLASNGALVALLVADTTPLAVDLDHPRSSLHLLPLDDRVWLADSGARLLVPMTGSDMGLVGVLVLGDKRSELPYSGDDRQILTTLAVSGGLVIENQLLRAVTDRTPPADRPSLHEEAAGECSACGLIHPLERTVCSCGTNLTPLPLPRTLLGKFHLERKLGAGGMGVVYAATDIALERTVAIKTLPRVSPEQAARLRREARAMARVQHHNLALIFGAESWRGTPLLVVEYLEGGTLLDRIRAVPLAIGNVVEIGDAIAAALSTLHDSRLLHRDVKPSNIGFKKDGTAKLLDFGLARLAGDRGGPCRGDVVVSAAGLATATATNHFAGTLLYMSPEARRGDPADVGFDLWALAMTLYHALAGGHPFDHLRIDGNAVFPAVPDPRTFRSDCPAALADLLNDALSPRAAHRPVDAAAFRARLIDVIT